MKGKQAIKDVGRVLDFTFAETDRIAKLYPAPKQGKDFPLVEAFKMEPRLQEPDRASRQLLHGLAGGLHLQLVLHQAT